VKTYMLSAHVEYSVEAYCFSSKAGETAAVVNETAFTHVYVSFTNCPFTVKYEYTLGT